jgi:hypothetical protein
MRLLGYGADKVEQALFEIPYPFAADDLAKAQIRAARRSAYAGVHGSLYLLKPEEAREEFDRLPARAERTQDPELADAVYLRRNGEGGEECGRRLPPEEAEGTGALGGVHLSQPGG